MATAYFMQLVTQMTDARTDQEHIEMLVYSKPSIPDRTNYILGKSADNPFPMMLEVEDCLIAQGAQVIAIPCITAHYFWEKLEDRGVTVIHAIRDTAEHLKENGVSSVGIMATDGAVQSRLFQEIFSEYGISSHLPSADGQKLVMRLIYENVKAGEAPNMEWFRAVKAELGEAGAQVVLLGCTELSLIKRDYDTGSGVLDVMEVMAKSAVENCGTLNEKYRRLITR